MMKSVTGILQPTSGNTVTYYFEMRVGGKREYLTLKFASDEHANAVPANVPIAISVSDKPNDAGEHIVSIDRPFFNRLDYYG